MNSRVQTLLTVPRRCVLLILTCVAACPWWAMANEPSANPTAMNFEAAGTIRMNLNVGDMQIVGAQGDRITVSWHSSRPEDESRVSVKVQRSGKNDATVVVDGPGNRVKYRVEVPRQSNVAIRMQAGNLDVRGVLGSVDADLLAGNMDLRVADPRHYRTVSASVTAGDITAQPGHADTSGLWRSFKATGNGDYELRARLLAGQLTIRSE
jgi:hypothetical protein